jgi:hypothetical protein
MRMKKRWTTDEFDGEEEIPLEDDADYYWGGSSARVYFVKSLSCVLSFFYVLNSHVWTCVELLISFMLSVWRTIAVIHLTSSSI